MKTPVIFVPGIKGTVLKNQYPVDFQRSFVWAPPLHQRLESAHLHPDDFTVDRDPDSWVAPHQAVHHAYEDIVDTLREEHSKYTYVFPYDWRKDNRIAAKQLEKFIHAVRNKYAVHEGSPPPKVTLIGHSMGGLVIKWCVRRVLGKKAPGLIKNIVTIATPYFGSLKALELLTPGARKFFGLLGRKSERHAARTMPGVYQLLPAYKGALQDSENGRALSIFDEENWQQNVREAVGNRFGPDFLKERLADAKKFSSVMQKPYPAEMNERVFAAYGTGTETLMSVKVNTSGGNVLDFSDAILDDGGDGTVHMLSSTHTKLALEQRIHAAASGVLQDVFLGHHAGLPNHSSIQDWILGILDSNPFAAKSFVSTG